MPTPAPGSADSTRGFTQNRARGGVFGTPGGEPQTAEQASSTMSALKELLKKGRASQPFNYLATTAVRGLLGAAGVRSELVIKYLHRMGTVRSRLPNGRELLLWSRGDDWVS